MKQKRTVAIDEDLIYWVQEEIKKRNYASLSHCVQKALVKLKEEYEWKET